MTVRGEDGAVIAEGKDLKKAEDTPIARLARHGNRIERADIWPGVGDIGRIVILPGGEAGILKAWWNAENHSEWRWQVEFYNHR